MFGGWKKKLPPYLLYIGTLNDGIIKLVGPNVFPHPFTDCNNNETVAKSDLFKFHQSYSDCFNGLASGSIPVYPQIWWPCSIWSRTFINNCIHTRFRLLQARTTVPRSKKITFPILSRLFRLIILTFLKFTPDLFQFAYQPYRVTLHAMSHLVRLVLKS